VIFDPPLEPVVFLRRWKRFLAEVRDARGRLQTVHLPNSGSMATCLGEGWPAMISDSRNPARKLRHTLEMLHNGRTWIGVQTHRANAVAGEALAGGRIPGIDGSWSLRPEVRSGESRIDWLAELDGRRAWVEVKSVTLRLEDGCAGFPDAVSARGRRHLVELARLAAAGDRALLLLLVQRGDCEGFRPAAGIDPAWARELERAMAAGVELQVLRVEVSPEGLFPAGEMEVRASTGC
jgi:sugar fermentation stimulation protein A